MRFIPTIRWFRLPCALSIAIVAVVIATPVDAVEREWHAGVGVGYAGVTWDGVMSSGFGVGVHGAYGLTDAYNLLVEIGGSTHDVSCGECETEECATCRNLLAGHASAGVVYTLDVIQWVPYMGLLVGGYRFSGADLTEPTYLLGFQGALGLDYRPTRNWGVGAQLRYHTFSSDPFTSHYFTAFARFELTWGW